MKTKKQQLHKTKLKLSYQTPFHFEELLAFFRARALFGIEFIDQKHYARTVHLELEDKKEVSGWLLVENDPAHNVLVLSLSESLLPATSIIVSRIRRMFDLDCDPELVYKNLAALEKIRPKTLVRGTRLPGCFEPFETCCRAILGQQVSIAAANKLAARIAQKLGAPLEAPLDLAGAPFEAPLDLAGTPLDPEPTLNLKAPQNPKVSDDAPTKAPTEELSRIWPSPEKFLSLDDAASVLGSLGVVRSRTHAICEIARMITNGQLNLDAPTNTTDAPADVPVNATDTIDTAGTTDAPLGTTDAIEQMEILQSIKGIGPWTANYIAMRVLSYPDAFLEKDIGVIHALPDMTPKERIKAVEPCRPWRSYAVINMWNALAKEEASKEKIAKKEAAKKVKTMTNTTRQSRKTQIKKPRTKRKQKMTIYKCEYESKLIGPLTIASDGASIVGCWFGNDRYFGYGVDEDMEQKDDLAVFDQVRAWLDSYFAKEKPNPRDLPLAARATDFQMKVREAMLDIAYGQTTTYGNIAKRLEKQSGKRQSAQAVGGAVGHNPLCIIVPCHRVVGADGSLTGFGGGIDMKVKLLEHEGVDMSKLYRPKHGTAIDPATWLK